MITRMPRGNVNQIEFRTYFNMRRSALFAMCRAILPLWALTFIMPVFGYAQINQPKTQRDTTSPDFIKIDHIGKHIEDKQGVEAIQWLSQGVQLRLDSTYIYADSAVIFGGSRLYAFGDVVIQQGDSLNVFTDTLYYFRSTDVAELIGEVTLQQGSKQLWTTDLTYSLSERVGYYADGGVLVDKDLQVTSKRGYYFADSEEILFRDSVIVLHPEFNLAADSMRYLAAEQRVVFTGPTNVFTEEAKIYCEGGYYDLDQKLAEFNQRAQYAGGEKTATADTIRYATSDGEVKMLGHVKVKEGDKHIEGDFLQYQERTGETYIKGDPAHYMDSTRQITSPEIIYNEKTNQVSTRGGGEISDGDLLMRAEHFDFDQASGIGRATGNVMWNDTAQHIGIWSDTVFYKKDPEYILAYGEKRALFYTLVDADTLYIASDTLNMLTQIDTSAEYDTMRLIRAYHDVRLFKSDMQGRADSLVFNDRDSIFTFYKQPVLWSDTTQFSADTIRLSVMNNQLNNVTLVQRAIIISEILGTYYDQIKGKSILAHFDSSAIQYMWVNGNAESIYYTRDDQQAFIGVNKTICSKMNFTFSNGEIHLLKYFGENTSSMVPMAEAAHDTLRLEGFNWRNEERPKHLKDLLE